MSADVCSTVPRLVKWVSAGWSFQASIILIIFWMRGSFAAVLQYKSSPGCCKCDFQFSGRLELPPELGIVGAAVGAEFGPRVALQAGQVAATPIPPTGGFPGVQWIHLGKELVFGYSVGVPLHSISPPNKTWLHSLS